MLFQEFTPAMLDFLAENHIRNSKPWYEEHKEDYRRLVVQPHHHLIELMTPTMNEIDPNFVTVPSRVLSRVRRDTRFTKNKDFYRDHVWLTFRYPRRSLGDSLCYYFEISQEDWGYGVGYYKMPGDVREEYQRMILQRDVRYQEARQALERLPQFELFGESYKRPRFPDAPETDQSWLNRKTVGVSYANLDFTTLFDGSFYDRMIDDLKQITPFYRFLRTAEDRCRKPL